MANDPRLGVRPGQRLSIAATQINAINALIRPNTGFGGGPVEFPSAPYTFVYAKNTSAAVGRWAVLSIIGMEIEPTSSSGGATAQFEEMPVLRCGAPSDDTSLWCVALEPINHNSIGKVAIAGVVQAKVEVGDASHGYVKPKSSSQQLQSTSVPGSEILWKESGTGTGKWALIRLGRAGGLRLGKISSTWTKGYTATVTEINADGTDMASTVTFPAINHFATVTVTSGTTKVACAGITGPAAVGDRWILIAAEC